MVQKSLLGCLAVLLTQYRESKEVFRLFDGPSKVKAWLESGLGCDSDTELCVKMLMDCLDDSTWFVINIAANMTVEYKV